VQTYWAETGNRSPQRLQTRPATDTAAHSFVPAPTRRGQKKLSQEMREHGSAVTPHLSGPLTQVLQELAPRGSRPPVAGLHRASPSATLDAGTKSCKAVVCCRYYKSRSREVSRGLPRRAAPSSRPGALAALRTLPGVAGGRTLGKRRAHTGSWRNASSRALKASGASCMGTCPKPSSTSNRAPGIWRAAS